MEPGAFKDRVLMEGNPHQLIEGLAIAAHAVGAEKAYIFLRWEYGKSKDRLRTAVSEAYARGYLGQNILKSGFSLELKMHVSAGRYICGEETALLNAIEGKRAIPRSKPPYPQLTGLWGHSAVVDNAETLCNLPHIIAKGADWFKGLSHTDEGGTKIYAVSGRVKNPGWWELPMGTTVRELLYDQAGGMKDGYSFKGVMPGGASTDFLLEQHLDTRMDFSSMQKAGSRLGTGTMIILDDRTCPVGAVHNLLSFFARESCGWCTPCREGLPWLRKILLSLENGTGSAGDMEILEDHAGLLAPGHTYCALAPGAVEPLQSALKYFRSDFEAHIEKKCCPWKT
jgi:NADH-quinone oxidoreductase subunit F